LTTVAGMGDPAYIEAITPAERKIYLNYYVEDQKEQERASRGNVFDVTSPSVPPGINTMGLNVTPNARR
jgi:hypothetical protein